MFSSYVQPEQVAFILDTDVSYCGMSILASLSTKIMYQMDNDSCHESVKH